MVEGIVERRVLDGAGQLRGFRNVDLAEILAEKDFGRLAEAVDAEGAARAQVDLVGVILEDLLLAELLLELQGDDDLGRLGGPALVLLQEEVLGQLHAQRGGAFAPGGPS